jgi:hypothetical protein
VLFHDSVQPGLVTEAANGYQVKVMALLLPGSDPERAVARLLPNWLVHDLSLSVGEPIGAPLGSPRSHPLFQAALDSLKNSYPAVPVGSSFLPNSVTDARFFRQQGIPTYGYSPFLFFSTDTMWVDRDNERIPLPGFISGTRLYSSLVEGLILGDSE